MARMSEQDYELLKQLAANNQLKDLPQSYWDSLDSRDFEILTQLDWWPGGIQRSVGAAAQDYPFAEQISTEGMPQVPTTGERLEDYPFAEQVSTEGVPTSFAGAEGVTGVPTRPNIPVDETADAPVVPGPSTPAPEMPDPSAVETTDWEKAAAEIYPAYYAIIQNNPEIRDLLRRSIGPPAYSRERFQAELFNTNWYKTTSESARQWQVLSAQDPAEAQQRVMQQAAEIRSTANYFGVSLTEDQITRLATDAQQFGFSLQQINNAIGMKALEGGVEGVSDLTRGYYGQEMRKRLNDYGVTLSDATFNQYLNKIAVGAESLDSFQDYAMNLGKSLFPALAAQFDAGKTFNDVVDPYKQTAARLLEISPDAIDFTQPQWQQAVTFSDPGSTDQRLMSSREWGDYLRRDRSFGYEYTTGAKQKAYQTANRIADMFGKV